VGTVLSSFLRWLTSLCPGWIWSPDPKVRFPHPASLALFPPASRLFPGSWHRLFPPVFPSCFPPFPLQLFPRCPGSFSFFAFQDRFPLAFQVVSLAAFPHPFVLVPIPEGLVSQSAGTLDRRPSYIEPWRYT